MKKILVFILLLTTFLSFGQDYRVVDWKTIPANIQLLNIDTFKLEVDPIDYNDVGVGQKDTGYYFIDFIARAYEIIDYDATTITVVDLAHENTAPVEGQIGRVYQSIVEGDSVFHSIGGVDVSVIDELSRWKAVARDNELFGRAITSLGGGLAMPFDSVLFSTGITGLEWEEGKLYYDSETTSPTFYSVFPDVSLQLGEELWTPIVLNVTGSLITDRTPVVISGGSSGLATISEASNLTYDESRLVGIATHNIANNDSGRVTIYGDVSGDWSALSIGVVYLGENGTLTNTRPTGGRWIIIVGYCHDNTSNGKLFVSPVVTERTAEINNTNGFPSDERINTTISFNNSSRYAKIESSGSEFYFYDEGVKYIITGPDSVQITDVSGLHVIYYDDDTLTTVANPTSGQVDAVIRTHAIVMYVYWNATDGACYYIGDERHGFQMDPVTHSYLHFTQKAKYLSGFTVSDMVVDGSGNVDASAQFAIGSGIIADEDLINITPSYASTTGLPIYYKDGATPEWKRVFQSGYSVYNTGSVSGTLYYNEDVAGTWQLSEVTNNDFVLCHVYGTNDIDYGTIAVMGENQYTTTKLAREGAEVELLDLQLNGFPAEEFIPLYSMIFQTSTGYSNDVQARVISTDLGDDYIDWRYSTITGAGGTGGTSTTYLDLTDTDNSYSGESNKILKVGVGEAGVNFSEATITDAGTVNIPAGQTYQIGGVDLGTDKLDLDGGNANQNIDIGNYVFSSNGLISDGRNIQDVDVDNSGGLQVGSIFTTNAKSGVGTQLGSAFFRMYTVAGESTVDELDGLLTAFYHDEGFTVPTWKGIESGAAYVDGLGSRIGHSWGYDAKYPVVTNSGSVGIAAGLHIASSGAGSGIDTVYSIFSENTNMAYLRGGIEFENTTGNTTQLRSTSDIFVFKYAPSGWQIRNNDDIVTARMLDDQFVLGGTSNSADFDFPSLKLSGYNQSGLGNYGGLLLDANPSYTSLAREFLITNALDANKFAIIRSTDANTTPTITGGVLSGGTADFTIDNTGAAYFAAIVEGDDAVSGNDLVNYNSLTNETFDLDVNSVSVNGSLVDFADAAFKSQENNFTNKNTFTGETGESAIEIERSVGQSSLRNVTGDILIIDGYSGIRLNNYTSEDVSIAAGGGNILLGTATDLSTAKVQIAGTATASPSTTDIHIMQQGQVKTLVEDSIAGIFTQYNEFNAGVTIGLPLTTGISQPSSIMRLKNSSATANLDIGSNSTDGFWFQSTNAGDLSVNYPLLLNPNGGIVEIGDDIEVSGAYIDSDGNSGSDSTILMGSASGDSALWQEVDFVEFEYVELSSLGNEVRTVESGAITVSSTDYTIIYNGLSAVDVLMPASPTAGKIYILVNRSPSNDISLRNSDDTADVNYFNIVGTTTDISRQTSVHLQYVGTAWYQIN